MIHPLWFHITDVITVDDILMNFRNKNGFVQVKFKSGLNQILKQNTQAAWLSKQLPDSSLCSSGG